MDPINGVVPPAVSPTPAPAVVPAATPAAPVAGATKPPEQSGQKFVPISVMHEERDRRQAAEAKFSEL